MRTISTALAAAALLVSAPGRADVGDPPPVRTLFLEGRDPACTSTVASLTAAITLACDASHASCRASSAPGGADRRLVLDCLDNDRWTLESFDASGMARWAVTLVGPADDRIRTGAMTAVRFETNAATIEEPHLPAPAPVPAAETAPRAAEPPARSAAAATGLVYGGFGVAAAGTILGVALAIDTMRLTSAVKTRCVNGLCDPSAASDLDAARREGTIADVAFVVAGAGAIAGVIGLIVWPRSPATTTGLPNGHLTPVVGLGSVGFQGAF